MSKRNMTPVEKEVKEWLIEIVLRPTHKLFAEHFENYDLHITDNPEVAARVFPAKGIIELNAELDDENVISLLIRHELMHLLFRHEQNGVKWLAPVFGINPHHITKKQYNWVLSKLYQPRFIPTLEKYGPITVLNAAADWDESRYYNDLDKDATKSLGGLLLELDHPEMMKMSYFELLDEIAKWEREYRRAAMQIIEGNLSKDATSFEKDPESDK